MPLWSPKFEYLQQKHKVNISSSLQRSSSGCNMDAIQCRIVTCMHRAEVYATRNKISRLNPPGKWLVVSCTPWNQVWGRLIRFLNKIFTETPARNWYHWLEKHVYDTEINSCRHQIQKKTISTITGPVDLAETGCGTSLHTKRVSSPPPRGRAAGNSRAP